MLGEVTMGQWLTIVGILLSAFATIATVVWQVAKSESALVLQIVTTNARVDNVKDIVAPYAQQIGALTSEIAQIKAAQAACAQRTETTARDITRLETRIDQVNSRINAR